MQQDAYWIVRFQQRILIDTFNAEGPSFLNHTAFLQYEHTPPIMVGQWHGIPCYATDVSELPDGFPAEPIHLRQVFSMAGPEAFALAGRATQLIDWQTTHRFCGRCGAQTQLMHHEYVMHCSACGLNSYPRISPAVMVLVRRGFQLLLARSPHFRPGVFSARAGFVEAGETLEECARREVMEEVGIEIGHMRYFESQSWPFPNSLMIAFVAEYAGGEINPDPGEIEAADWFDIDNLPRLPDQVSIARRLIDSAVRELMP